MRHTEESKRKLSEMRKGKNNPFYGKKHTVETKEKMSRWVKEHNSKRQYDLRPVSIKIPNSNDLYYLAGMIDADGSIRFARNRPFIAIYNTNKYLMDWLIKNVGGGISGTDKRGREISYSWRISAAKDVYLLALAILFILKIKSGDAKAVIRFLRNKYGDKINE